MKRTGRQIVFERHRQGILASVVVVGLMLSGCAAITGTDSRNALPPSPVTQTAAIPEPLDVPDVVSKPEPEADKPLLPVPDPASLVGYDQAALENLLGVPSFARRDPPAELWQYRNDRCTLDLFLYEATSGGYRVEHLEFRETATSPDATEHCLRAIIERNLARVSTS